MTDFGEGDTDMRTPNAPVKSITSEQLLKNTAPKRQTKTVAIDTKEQRKQARYVEELKDRIKALEFDLETADRKLEDIVSALQDNKIVNIHYNNKVINAERCYDVDKKQDNKITKLESLIRQGYLVMYDVVHTPINKPITKYLASEISEMLDAIDDAGIKVDLSSKPSVTPNNPMNSADEIIQAAYLLAKKMQTYNLLNNLDQIEAKAFANDVINKIEKSVFYKKDI